MQDFYKELNEYLQDTKLINTIKRDLQGCKFYIPKLLDKNHLLHRYGEFFFSYMINKYGEQYFTFPR